MAWDSSRPVPWQQLIRTWLLYVAVMAAVFVLLFRDRPLIGLFAGLLISGPLYLAIGWVLAKFGYQRKTWRQLRAESAAQTADEADGPGDAPDVGPRPKPAPTRRTGGTVPGRPGGSRKRRR